MYKKLLSITFLAFTIILFAQNLEFKVPNYNEIKKHIEDKKSEFYYPDLLSKLKKNDTLLTKDQYKHLYFGYIFQKEYNPYHRGKSDEKLSKYYRGEFEKNEFPEVINTLKESLEEFPLDLRSLNFLSYLYHLNGSEDMAKTTSLIFQGLFEAILSSGDGNKCETAFHVISVSHEYVLLNMFDLKSISQSFNGKCDFLQFEKDKYRVPGIYFNVEKLQEKNINLLR
ncbi:DUF4919 domain-containing protein [Epilithonimonas mollis]|uniref:DUF4919 domain-containing protein n=1 Tax=Epilithonimonas mollis TaxID=216903 RepID=A0A1M6T2H9_9FLAO|nr:DUF4919 domain-containing protein [Epilithonimonas mollis]SHK51213.1 protein of unknown function [Epilithonimonas mollis]